MSGSQFLPCIPVPVNSNNFQCKSEKIELFILAHYLSFAYSLYCQVFILILFIK